MDKWSNDNFPSHSLPWPPTYTVATPAAPSRWWRHLREAAIVIGVAVMTLGAVCTLIGADVLMTGVLAK